MNKDGSNSSAQLHQQGDALATKLDIKNDEEVAASMDSNSPRSDQAHIKYAALISNYEEINEKLRKERHELKNRKRESKSENVNSVEIEEATKELAEVQNLLEAKNREFISNRLEASLWYKATSMFQTESTTRRLVQGMLKHRRSGLKPNKNVWVEVHFSTGKAYKNDYEAGYVMLKYTDSKDAETVNQCLILEIFVPESNSKEAIFTVRVSAEGTAKELVFACETDLQRDRWVKDITNTLADVREIYNSQKRNYTLKLEFGKEKIGLLIKERFLKCSADQRSTQNSDNAQETIVKPQCSEKETAQAIDKEMKEEVQEQPCELLVIEIIDQDLSALGLKENSIVAAINDTVLVGRLCSEQLRLLAETPKPFTLTFKGRNFKKTSAPLNSALHQEYLSILKELVAFGNSDVSIAFTAMVEGTFFEQELRSSTNKNETISALLGNQRRLIDLLQDFTAKAGKQQEELEYKE